MFKIGVTNQKGGVGKTTVVFHLAYLFSQAKRKTVVIDMDPQGNLTTCFIEDLQEENNIKLIFEDKTPQPLKINDNLTIIGSNISLSKYEAEAKLANFFKLRGLLDQLDADIVLIDTPPSLGLFTSNVLIAASHIVVPADVSRFSLFGLSDLIDSIESVKKSTKSEVEIVGVLFASTNTRVNFFKKVEEEMKEKYGELLFDVIIPESVKVKEAVGMKKPIFDIYPEHKASVAYVQFFKELGGRLDATR